MSLTNVMFQVRNRALELVPHASKLILYGLSEISTSPKGKRANHRKGHAVNDSNGFSSGTL
ncbi:hypothetical protein LJR029_005230 [Caballeronia sp. LjRoot29]|uniref:hypothetical protein n=1 Tax=Caballeronia sp. LjRoot29 TaxID=3342315 RepID=UPI003ECCB05B